MGSAVRAIVTDIEGTTSSIDFVHQTLFPFARARLRGFLRSHLDDPRVQQVMEDVCAIERADLSPDAVADVLERWITLDRKDTPLKALQGMIWARGYAAGELQGHVYDDTPVALRRWHAQGLKLYVYSSGSVEAQKLIFGHTAHGDLTPLFSGFFDTKVGHKREVKSYRAIAQAIDFPSDCVLFLSDVGEELDAARGAGMQTCQIIRDEKTVVASDHRGKRDLTSLEIA